MDKSLILHAHFFMHLNCLMLWAIQQTHQLTSIDSYLGKISEQKKKLLEIEEEMAKKALNKLILFWTKQKFYRDRYKEYRLNLDPWNCLPHLSLSVSLTHSQTDRILQLGNAAKIWRVVYFRCRIKNVYLTR